MTLLDKSDALDVADEILGEYGEPLSYETLRQMLALAWAKGTRVGLIEGAEIYERKPEVPAPEWWRP